MLPYYFIQIPHTGSEGLQRILRQQPNGHTAREVIGSLGLLEWNDLVTFAIIRNPYDRAVSLYCKRLNANTYKMLEHRVSFLNFLNLTLKHKRKPYFDKPSEFLPQWDWIKDNLGESGIMFLPEYEKYEIALATILDFLKHPNAHGVRIRRPPEFAAYRWERYFQGTEGEMAADLVNEYWSADFTHLPYVASYGM